MHTKSNLFLAAFIALITAYGPSSALSQDSHATTDDGKDVTLHENGKWEFAAAKTGAGASQIFFDKEKRFSVQLKNDWKKPDAEYGDDAELSFSKDKPYLYGMAVAEDIPMSSDDVVSYIAASFDSTATIFQDEPRTVNGKKMRLVGIDVMSEGIMMRMHVLVHTGESWYAKFITWTIKSAADKYSEAELLDYYQGIKILKD